MAYVGKGPEQVLSGVASKYTFTGDGSTTTFDITTDIPAGGENDIQVFVDNVRQEPGSGASYTVGLDGSNNLRRITFNTAPEASQSIYVINPRRIEAVAGIGDNTVTTAKLQDTAVTTAKIYADAVTNAKIADEAISNEHFATTVITGNTELSEEAANTDYLLIYDASAGTLKKIKRQYVALAVPTISSVSPTNVTTGDGTGNATLTITGEGFDSGATAKLLTSAGAEVSFDTVTRDSSTQITGVIAKSSLSNANENYGIKVTNGSALSSSLTNQISIDAQPVFQTAAGSLGTVTDSTRSSTTLTVVAADPESAGNVTFELYSGSLPTGASATTVNQDGVSKYQISGFSAVGGNTTSTFTIRAFDAASNTSTRQFTITILAPVTQSFTSSGTFSVPSGVTSVDVLVVAGGGSGAKAHSGSGTGGGGAGGLIYRPGFPVTPGGSVSVTVGCGAAPQGTPDSAGNSGQDSVFGTLTAKGGGAGGKDSGSNPVTPGGSGGGGAVTGSGGTATQPTQPGDSGTYGFGNNGGTGGPAQGGGGGGGAGAVGGTTSTTTGGQGGVGRAYTIADGTTPVYYAGGGGGNNGGCGTAGQGGQGGGTAGGGPSPGSGNATANRGGGSGGVRDAAPGSGSGGKGIVIVSY